MDRRRRATEPLPVESSEIPYSPEHLFQQILNESRLLSEEEFSLCFKEEYSYTEYINKYYDIYVKHFLIKECDKQAWYTERALCEPKGFSDRFIQFRDFIANKKEILTLSTRGVNAILESDLFDECKSLTKETPVNILVVNSLNEDTLLTPIIREIEEQLSAKEVFVSQQGSMNRFKRTVYIRVDEMKIEEATEKISQILPKGASVTVTALPTADHSCVRQVGMQFCDPHTLATTEECAKKILRAMANQCKVPEAIETLESLEPRMHKEEVPDLYILALRMLFCFCYYCGTKYNNPYEMVLSCGILHIRTPTILDASNPETHQNSLWFYSLDRVSYLAQGQKEIDITIFSKKQESTNLDEYVCKYCSKRFASLAYFENHLNRQKHIEYEKYSKLHHNLQEVINTLTYPTIELIEQRYQPLSNDIYYLINKNIQEQTPQKNEIVYDALEKMYLLLENEQRPIYVLDAPEN
ncbi:hypothetical protein NEOKW01_0900 [Nematocida sp. AWRm80]|nr:hypothetical protein NEOKW01_0900 [Nematocida sp. AWRm80]